MRFNLGTVFIVGLLVVVGGLLAWRQRALASERGALAEWQTQAVEAARLRAEHQRRIAARPAEAELETLRASETSVARLWAELEMLRKRESVLTSAAPAPERFAAGSVVAIGDCQNAGAGTPRAALETVLWAAAGGDVTAFAQRLTFDGGGVRERAAELLARLPENLRERCATPEQLIAFCSIQDVPLGTVEIREWYESTPQTAGGRVMLTGPDGRTRDVNLLFTHQPDATWKLVVFEPVVEKYATLLTSGVRASPRP